MVRSRSRDGRGAGGRLVGVSRPLASLAVAAMLSLGACRAGRSVEPPSTIVATEGAAAPALLSTPLADDPLGVTIHRLSNGMTVYLSTDRSTPRVFSRIAVRAGSRHDPAHATGLAHYLEHMLFKGTDELGTVDFDAQRPHLKAIARLYDALPDAPTQADRNAIFADIDAHTQAVAKTSINDEYERAYATLGFTSVNAATGHDETSYVAEIPSNRVRAWAQFEAERFSGPVFRLFWPELEAVYEEKNLELDDPSEQMWLQMTRAAFPDHPYGTQDILGTVEHLKTPAFGEMVAFYERWYRPSNMAIILVGDVDASVLPELEETLGRLPPTPPAPASSIVEPPRPHGRIETRVVGPGEQLVMLTWRIAPAVHDDTPALRLMERLLSAELVGHLNVELELTGKLAWAQAELWQMREAGAMLVQASVREDSSHAATERLLRDTLTDFVRDGPTEQQLAAAKKRMRVDEMRTWEVPAARAQRIQQAFTHFEPWEQAVAQAKKLDEVTVADIRRVAASTFNEDFVASYVLRGTNEPAHISKPKITPLQLADQAHSPLAERILAEPVQPIAPSFLEVPRDVQVEAMPFGELITTNNDRNDLFDLAITIDVGYRVAPLVCHAIGVRSRSGTTTQSAAEFQKSIYALGASIRYNCGPDSLQVVATGVDTDFEATVALVRQWLAEPKIGETQRAESLAAALTARKAELDDDDALEAALDNAVHFGPDSPHRVRPTNAAVAAATVPELETIIRQLTNFEHRLLYYGPRSQEEIKALPAFGPGDRPVPPIKARVYVPRSHTEVHILNRAAAAAAVTLVYPGATTPRSQIGPGRVLSQYMHRLAFDEIRGSRGLAYAVQAWVGIGDRRDESVVGAYAECQPDKVLDVVALMRQTLTNTTFDVARLDSARSSMIGKLRSQRVSPHYRTYSVASWPDLGVTRDPGELAMDSRGSLTAAHLGAMLGTMTERPPVITIVGDKSQIDSEGLSKVGAVYLHEPAELFSYGPFPDQSAGTSGSHGR